MLLVLTLGFALSQAFRTVAAMLAPPLAREFALSARELGIFGGGFHFAFGILQPFMGVGMDLYGLRRTVLTALPLAVGGALLSAAAQRFEWLVLGQVLIGAGCAPAFVACTLFIARGFPAERFSALSGLILGIGSLGLLLTGTPLAWVIDTWSWRAGFLVLAAWAALAWAAIFLAVRDPAVPAGGQPASVREALRGYRALLTLPHTAGILLLSFVAYSSFLTLRGLWLGPLLIDRHGLTLIQSGHVALAASVAGLFGAPLFGRIDPGAARRRQWLTGWSFVYAALLAAMGWGPGLWPDILLAVVLAFLSGYMVLQYADTRQAYPAAMTGRAIALLTMSMFLGVGAVQWLTGQVAALVQGQGDPYRAVLFTLAGLLAAGALAFRLLPAPAGGK